MREDDATLTGRRPKGRGGRRAPGLRNVPKVPGGEQLTLRRADEDDLDAALALHGRCSPRTLAQRYHGPAGDEDSYLGHLLSPSFGRSLGAWTNGGRLVALGHLLWDGEEAEVALLVEDSWQRRGAGSRLLRRLVRTAVEAGITHVYAVARPPGTGMAAVMRGLGLGQDYRAEEDALVITAAIPPAVTAWPAPVSEPVRFRPPGPHCRP